MIAESLDGKQTARILLKVLNELKTESEDFVAGLHDRASANYTATDILKQAFSDSFLDVGCFSHTMDHCGDHFDFPHLDVFNQSFTSCFKTSFKARGIWKVITGQSVKLESDTRWWSLYDVDEQVLVFFADMPRFIAHMKSEDLAPQTIKKLDVYFESQAVSTGQRTLTEMQAANAVHDLP